jgi:hypothetical protein
MRNIYRWLSKGASYHMLVHLEKRFQRRRLSRNYKACSFRPDPLTNMALTGNSCFWLVDFLIIFSSETAFPNEPTYGRKHPNKNCLWGPCLLTDQDEMSKLYRGISIDASYKVSVHLAKRLQRGCFRNRPIRNKNCLWSSEHNYIPKRCEPDFLWFLYKMYIAQFLLTHIYIERNLKLRF